MSVLNRCKNDNKRTGSPSHSPQVRMGGERKWWSNAAGAGAAFSLCVSSRRDSDRFFYSTFAEAPYDIRYTRILNHTSARTIIIIMLSNISRRVLCSRSRIPSHRSPISTTAVARAQVNSTLL